MEKNLLKLVDQARQGDNLAMEDLAEGMRTRLQEYVNRLTLDRDLTDEIVQDSLIKMMKELHTLKQIDQFWPWLSKIALNRMRRLYRENGKRRTRLLDSDRIHDTFSNDHNVVADAITRELRQIVLGAMRQLQPHLRAVLVLRCYEQLSFPEIADRTGSSEFKVRALFVRAKHALGKNLTKNGFGKSSLLGALVLFGKMTATSEASLGGVSVSSATVWAGLLPTLSVAITSKMALIGMAVMGSLSVMSPMVLHNPATAQVSMAYTQEAEHSDTIVRQHWYYYPPHSQDSVQIQIRSGRDNRVDSPILLQNEYANYLRTDKEVFLCNAHMWHQDGSVMRLPTDSPDLASFLNSIEGKAIPAKDIRYDDRGLMVAQDSQDTLRVLPNYDVADEACFRAQWPAHLKIVDQRDRNHQRGWTYFRITGHLGEDKITGVGRIPLVSARYKSHAPWVKLDIGQNLTIEDNPAWALIRNRGQAAKRYTSGTFFRGLMRPWQGLHTLDTIRRDAAMKQINFQTEYNPGQEEAVVRLSCDPASLIYRINMNQDLIEEIQISLSDGTEGQINFSYPDQVPESDEMSMAPRTSSVRRPGKHSIILWPVSLAVGTWAD